MLMLPRRLLRATSSTHGDDGFGEQFVVSLIRMALLFVITSSAGASHHHECRDAETTLVNYMAGMLALSTIPQQQLENSVPDA
jgi:hypothetical protein